MIILEDMSPEKRKRYLEERKVLLETQKKNLFNLEQDSNKYEIIQKGQFCVLGKSIACTNIRSEWDILHKRGMRNVEVEVSISQEEEQIGGEWFELFNFMKKLTSPLKKTKLELSPKGYILNVLNNEEIMSQWNEVKKEFVDDDSLSNVLATGDIDYSNPIMPIRKNIIYQLFFFCYYKRNDDFFNKLNIIGKDILLQSVIFPEYSFEVDINEKAYKRENGLISFSQFSKCRNIDERSINGLYNKKYKQFFDENNRNNPPINYSIGYNSDFDVFEDTGKLAFSKSTLNEKVNINLYYELDIEIKLI